MFRENREWVTPEKVANQLDKTTEEVDELISAKELESKRFDSQTWISAESVYAYSGLRPLGRQTEKKRGRPLKIQQKEKAQDEINTEIEEHEDRAHAEKIPRSRDGRFPRHEATPGDTQKDLNKESCSTYTEGEVRMAVRIAYAEGRLSVYESLKSFERR